MILKIIGWALIISSLYFLWIVFFMAGIFLYGIFSRGGSGVEFTGDGLLNIIYGRILPGVLLLLIGIYTVRKRIRQCA